MKQNDDPEMSEIPDMLLSREYRVFIMQWIVDVKEGYSDTAVDCLQADSK